MSTANGPCRLTSLIAGASAITLFTLGLVHGASYYFASFLCLTIALVKSRRAAKKYLVTCLLVAAIAGAYQLGTAFAVRDAGRSRADVPRCAEGAVAAVVMRAACRGASTT